LGELHDLNKTPVDGKNSHFRDTFHHVHFDDLYAGPVVHRFLFDDPEGTDFWELDRHRLRVAVKLVEALNERFHQSGHFILDVDIKVIWMENVGELDGELG